MNLEKFYLVSERLSAILNDAEIPTKINGVIASLSNQINTPNEGNLNSVSLALSELTDAYLESELDALPQTWVDVIELLNIGNMLDLEYPRYVRAIISEKEPLLNEARDIIQKDHQKLQQVLSNFSSINNSLAELGIQKGEVEAGEAELSIFIPEELFSKELRKFTKDVNALERFISVCSEVALGEVEHVKLKQISTTDPILFLLAAGPTVLLVLEIVNKLLEGYEKVQNIRAAKRQIELLDIEIEATGQLDQAAKDHIVSVINEIVTSLRDRISQGRSVEETNLLETKLKRVVTDTAARIDRGVKIEGWAEEIEEEDEELSPGEEEANSRAREIQELAKRHRRFVGEDEPILNLPSPTDDEDEEDTK